MFLMPLSSMLAAPLFSVRRCRYAAASVYFRI